MDEKDKLKLIENLQKAVEQMKIDDIEEQPESAFETFSCLCCGKEKILAGSVQYDEFILCNDCVLLAETGFALGKISNIHELIESMEETRFENQYNSIFSEDENINN